jgi:hypothetical protein
VAAVLPGFLVDVDVELLGFGVVGELEQIEGAELAVVGPFGAIPPGLREDDLQVLAIHQRDGIGHGPGLSIDGDGAGGAVLRRGGGAGEGEGKREQAAGERGGHDRLRGARRDGRCAGDNAKTMDGRTRGAG